MLFSSRCQRHCLLCTDVGGGTLGSLDLLDHAEHVPVLPALDQFAIRYAHDGDAADVDGFLGGGDAERVTRVPHLAGPAHTNSITFGDRVFDGDLEIGEGSVQAIEKRVEAIGTDGVRSGFMQNRLRRQHLGDGLTAALIPYFFEPTER